MREREREREGDRESKRELFLQQKFNNVTMTTEVRRQQETISTLPTISGETKWTKIILSRTTTKFFLSMKSHL